MSEHLSTCSTCRKEAVIFASLNKARQEIEQYKVSDDFNTKLLNRIARERFAETRTKAHLPKKAPSMAWGKAVPALVAACLVLVVSVFVMSPGIRQTTGIVSSADRGLDDSYKTVQPTSNPNMAVTMDRSWSLSDELAKAERVSRISSSLTAMDSFERHTYASGLRQASHDASSRIPYVSHYFRIRPVVRIYGLPDGSTVKEVTKVY